MIPRACGALLLLIPLADVGADPPPRTRTDSVPRRHTARPPRGRAKPAPTMAPQPNGATMSNSVARNADYRWGAARGGLEVGIAAPSTAVAGETVDVRAAIRNQGPQRSSFGPDFTLVIRTDDREEPQVGGPRPSAPLTIEAGGTLQFASWRVSPERLGSAPGPCRLWVVARGGDGSDLRSGEAAILLTPRAPTAGDPGPSR